MKIALLLTGHARLWVSQRTYEGIKTALLDHHDVDIFISTWSIDNLGRAKGTADWAEPMPINLEDYIQLFQPKKIHIEDHYKFYANRFPNIELLERPEDVFKVNSHAAAHGSWWLERLRDQWYMVKQGWDLIDNPEQYDIIIRSRSDSYLEPFDFQTDNLVVPDRKVDGWQNWSVCDLMAYGPPAMMEKYCTMFDHMESMYVNDNVNIVHADEVLGIYLKKYCGITPTLKDIPFHWSLHHPT